jgi:hypothetical protein
VSYTNTRPGPLFWILLIVFLAIGAWWIFYIPYQPERTFSAIPINASVVSVHRDLAGEWDNVLKNPMILRAVKAAGVEEADLEKVKADPVVKKWVDKLVSDQTILAYVPSLGTQQKPALVCASWIGGQSRRLRWQMAWIKSRDFIPVKLNGGELTVWLTRTKFGKSNLRLSLALTEGMVLACISEDPVGVRTLLEAAETYPGRLTVAMAHKPDEAIRLLNRSPRHWGWIDNHRDMMAYELILDPERLTLYLSGHLSIPSAPPLSETSGLKTVKDLTGTTSDLTAIIPLSWLQPLMGAEANQLWLDALRPLCDTNGTPPDALAFVALLNQQHNGRLRGPMGSVLRGFIKGVKTPTLLVGLQVGSRDAADTRIKEAITKLNSHYNLSLVLRQADSDGTEGLTLIEESRKNFYGSFEPDECIAYAMSGDWLILASNASVLKKFLGTPHEGAPAWGPLSSPALSALGWINLSSVAPTVKNAAGVLKLATLASPSDQSAELREKLNQAGLWAEVLRALNQAKITLGTTGPTFQAKLEIGKP